MSPSTTLSALLLLAVASNVQAADTFNTTMTQNGLYIINFTTFAIVNFPPCEYSGQQANLKISPTTSEKVVTLNVTVPQCRVRRDSGPVFLSDSNTGSTVTRNLGVRVEGLLPNTNYIASYNIGNIGVTGANVNFTTGKYQNYTDILDTVQRSGGMVVITVLLSIAMALLILSLVGSLVIGGKKP